MEKEKFVVIMFFVFFAVFLGGCANLPKSYPNNSEKFQYGKIHLKSGKVLFGEALTLNENKVSATINNEKHYFNYNDIKSLYSGNKKSFSLTWGLLGTAITAVPCVMLVALGTLDDYEPYNVVFAVGFPIIGGTIAGSTAPLSKNIKWKLIYEK